MSEQIALSVDTPAGRWRLRVGPSGVPSVLEGQDGRILASFGPDGGDAVFKLDASEHLWLLYDAAPTTRQIRLEPAPERTVRRD